MPPQRRTVQISEHARFIQDLEEIAEDFPAENFRIAIRWRCLFRPDHGKALRGFADIQGHVVRGMLGYPTYRYLFRRHIDEEAYRVELLRVRLVPAGSISADVE